MMQFACIFLTLVVASQAFPQGPPRLQIPGAVLIAEPPRSQLAYRPQARFQLASPAEDTHAAVSRLRRPQQPLHQQQHIRPVIEEAEDDEPPPQAPQQYQTQVVTSYLDDEVARLGLNALQSAVRQVDSSVEEQQRPLLTRPVPITRQDIRESPRQRQHQPPPQYQEPQRPAAVLRAERPIIRQELKQEQLYQQRPQQQQQVQREEQPAAPVRRPVAQQVRVQQPQPQPQPIQRQQQHVSRPQQQQTRPAPQYLSRPESQDESRTRKPPVKILRKYRTENEDGSITWGYENEDGSFKEELIGTDCITRGKYGYIDPDGVTREYSYETGAKCDEPEEEELEDLPAGARPAQYQNLPPGVAQKLAAGGGARKPLRVGAQQEYRLQ